MTTGERMKQRRKEIGFSAEKVAERLGVSPATIYRYEKGDIEKVPVDSLAELAKILQTTPAYLMGWEEQPTPKPTSPAGLHPDAQDEESSAHRRDRLRRPHHGPAEQGRGCGCPGGRPL